MQIKAFVKNNAPVICTATAVTATTAAVVLSARGHLKARDIVASENLDRDEPLTRVEDIKLTWKYYAPAAASYIIAVASVVFLNKAYTSHISAIVSAAAVSERLLTEYVSKVEERLDKDTIQEVRDEMAQEHLDEDKPVNREVIFLGDDECLFRDGFSGRYFMSSKNHIQDCINHMNRAINHNGYASLTDFYEYIGLEPTDSSDYLGWGSDGDLMHADFGSAMTVEGKPCIEYSFRPAPTTGHNVWA